MALLSCGGLDIDDYGRVARSWQHYGGGAVGLYSSLQRAASVLALSHPKISILGCEYIFQYNYPSSEYSENFTDFFLKFILVSIELNPFNGEF